MPKFTLFSRKTPLTDEEENALSIVAIPPEQLPDEEARQELIRRAMAGQEVYAYRPAFQDQYVVWIREGAPDQEMRHDPAEWALWWHHEGEPRPMTQGE